MLNYNNLKPPRDFYDQGIIQLHLVSSYCTFLTPVLNCLINAGLQETSAEIIFLHVCCYCGCCYKQDLEILPV